MKILNLQYWLVGAAVAAFLAGAAQAQNTPDVSVVNSTAPAVTAAPATPAPELASSVSQVLQLSQAKISDGTIVSFINNSSTSYPLAASQIVYLKQQGVSDAVLNAMLNQHPAIIASSAPEPDNSTPAQTATATAPTVTTYETVPSSSVYVIPDTQTYYYDSGYYGYPYYGYPYYYGPGVSIGLGWGWHGGYGGGWHGGYGGGWHGGGGGWHGGGGGWHGGGGGWHR